MNYVVRTRLGIRRSARGAFALMAVLSLGANAEPPANEPIPASSASQRNEDAARNNQARKCEALPDAERAECEQRELASDASDAPPTSSPPSEMTEEERASSDSAIRASEAESDADVAGDQPTRSTTRIHHATRDEVDDEDSADDEASPDEQDKDAQHQEQHDDSNSEADTLGPPGK